MPVGAGPTNINRRYRVRTRRPFEFAFLFTLPFRSNGELPVRAPPPPSTPLPPSKTPSALPSHEDPSERHTLPFDQTSRQAGLRLSMTLLPFLSSIPFCPTPLYLHTSPHSPFLPAFSPPPSAPKANPDSQVLRFGVCMAVKSRNPPFSVSFETSLAAHLCLQSLHNLPNEFPGSQCPKSAHILLPLF